MKKRAILPLICIAISTILSGCNNPKAASKENFTKVLSEDVAKNPYKLGNSFFGGAISCTIDLGTIPQEIPSYSYHIKNYEALKNAGILTSEFVREEPRNYGEPVKYSKYDLSEKGKQIAKQSENGGVYLPYCQVAFKEVKLFTEPTDSPAGKISVVDYSYAVEKVDDWVNNPEILQHYPAVKKVVDSVGKPIESKKPLVLTNEGWSTGEK